MSEKRNITKEDVLLRTRLNTEGARYKSVKEQRSFEIRGFEGIPWRMRIALDGCEMVIPYVRMFQNPRSRLEATVDGDDVTISDLDEVQATAKLEPRASWRDRLLSDGTPVDSAIMCTDDYQSNILASLGCATARSGKTCRFCDIGPDFEANRPFTSFSETLKAAEPAIEATVIAIEDEWTRRLQEMGKLPPGLPSQYGETAKGLSA